MKGDENHAFRRPIADQARDGFVGTLYGKHVTTKPDTIHRWLLWGAILALFGAAWTPLLGKPLYFDDLAAIAWNDQLRDPANFWRMFTDYAEVSHEGTFRPLLTATYFLDSGLHVPPQVANLLLHALTALMLGLVGATWVGRRRSAWLAAVFAVHPLTANCVAFPGFREDILAALLGLTALWLWLRAMDRERATGWTIAGIAVYVLALLSKEIVLLLPLVAAVELWVGRDDGSRPARRRWLRLIPWLATMAAFGAFFLLTAADRPAPTYFGSGFLDRLLTIGPGLGRAVWLPLLPVDQRLAYDFFGPAAPGRAIFGLVLFSALALLIARWTWRRSPAAVGGALFLATFLPASNILLTIWHVFDERFLYFPTAGLVLAVGGLIGRRTFPPRVGRAVVVAGLVVVLAFAALAGRRAHVLADPLRAWSETTVRSPEQPLAWNALATVHFERREYQQCADAARRAAGMPDLYINARVNLQRCLFELGRYDQVLELLGEDVAREPHNPKIVLRYGALLARTGRCDALHELAAKQPDAVAQPLAGLAKYCVPAAQQP